MIVGKTAFPAAELGFRVWNAAMEVDKGAKFECFSNSRVKVKKEDSECNGCLKLRAEIRKANGRCADLELDIGKKLGIIEWLERKLGLVELEKLKIEDEVIMLKQRNEELDKGFRTVKEEHDVFSQLMIENKVLECGKKAADSEVGIWKAKCNELEIKVIELEKRFAALTGTPQINTPLKQCSDGEGFKVGIQCELKSTVSKRLDFLAEKRPYKNISPSTPPFGPIVVSDSDDDLNSSSHKHSADLHCKVQNKVRSSSTGLWVTLDGKELTLKDGYEAVVKHERNEEEITCNSAGERTPKRRNAGRRVAFAVSSDSEIEDDIPISGLKRINQLKRSSDTLLVFKRRSVDDSFSGDNPRKQSRSVKKSVKELQEFDLRRNPPPILK